MRICHVFVLDDMCWEDLQYFRIEHHHGILGIEDYWDTVPDRERAHLYYDNVTGPSKHANHLGCRCTTA